MGLFDGVEEVVQWHENAIVQSVSILGRVQKSMLIPYEVDTLGYSRCPDFADNFVEADGSHMVEVVTSKNFWASLMSLSLNHSGHVRCEFAICSACDHI